MIFVSYSWINKKPDDEVLSLVNDLRDLGYDVSCDVMLAQQEASISFPQMMQENLTKSDKIIIVLSKKYKEKADSFKGGVGDEYRYIITDISTNKNKYILVSFTRNLNEILPEFLRGREVIFLDKNESSIYDKLIQKINETQEYAFNSVNRTKYVTVPKQIGSHLKDSKKKDKPYENLELTLERLFFKFRTNHNFKRNILIIVVAIIFFSCIGMYQITLFNICGVPFKLALDFMSFSIIKVVKSIIFLVIHLLLMVLYYRYARKRLKGKLLLTLFSVIVIAILSTAINLSIRNSIMIFFVWMTYILLLSFSIYIHTCRPRKIINQIIEKEPIWLKITVVFSEFFLYSATIILAFMFLANAYLMLPLSRTEINEKIVIASTNAGYLVADYSLEHDVCVLDKHSYKILGINDKSFNALGRYGFEFM